jgi:hypothetical protein
MDAVELLPDGLERGGAFLRRSGRGLGLQCPMALTAHVALSPKVRTNARTRRRSYTLCRLYDTKKDLWNRAAVDPDFYLETVPDLFERPGTTMTLDPRSEA